MLYVMYFVSLILLASAFKEIYAQHLAWEKQSKSTFELKKLCIKPVGIYTNRD